MHYSEVFANEAFVRSNINLRTGVTDISQQVYDLHMTIFYICVVIGIIVFGAMFYAIIFHRKSKGAKAANFHESIKVEIAWTIIPVIILVVMAIPATKTLIAMEDPSESDLTILVTGSQWKWHYKYLEHDIEFYSLLSTPKEQIGGQWIKGDNYLLDVDKQLVIPTNKKVRFLVTSDDVIHSWWVPDFAVKKDANPGFINEAWTKVNEEGIYRGQCAELCGKDHGFMPVVVEAVSPDDFDAWLANKKAEKAAAQAEEKRLLAMNMSKDELMSEGESVYMGYCAACHQQNGMGLPGVFPALVGSPITTGDVKAHIDIVLHGKKGTAMQAFAKQLTLKQVAAVVTYERNAWGINSGELIQPKDVHQLLQE
ncbi:cytochrome c oxidase subunit II [Catenovulum sp. 2E275]|nr:cytochrome c oxidase subunit II [Catenovulum sp. 2E275]MCU4674436.1 cytochrome c oxidase subunit II [Catenovulum sp. 2E275]